MKKILELNLVDVITILTCIVMLFVLFLNSLGFFSESEEKQYEIVVIEKCEYIKYKNAMTHKGDCKNCNNKNN